MSQIHDIIKQSQTQIDHCPSKNQTYLFNGWDQNLKRDKFVSWSNPKSLLILNFLTFKRSLTRFHSKSLNHLPPFPLLSSTRCCLPRIKLPFGFSFFPLKFSLMKVSWFSLAKLLQCLLMDCFLVFLEHDQCILSWG